MKWIRRILKERRCSHLDRKMTWTDLVLSKHVCTGCGKTIVEPYNGFKILSQYERK